MIAVDRWAVVVGLGVALGCACGSSDESNAANDPGGTSVPSGAPVPLSALGDAYETVLCQHLIECRGAIYTSVEQCKADAEAPGLADVEAAVAEGRLEYDAAAVGACRRAIEEYLCSLPYLFTPSLIDVLDDCTKNAGRQGAGEPCRHDIECAAGHSCALGAGCPGECLPFAQEGEACDSDAGAECMPVADMTLTELFALSVEEIRQLSAELEPNALRCIGGVCRTLIPVGGACSTDSDCLGDAWCDGTGVCRAAIAEGGLCPEVDVECAEGLFCDRLPPLSEGTCRPMSGSGGPCTLNGDCEGELDCVQPDPSMYGVCRGPGLSGDPCNSSTQCAEGLGCEADVCTELPGAGQACFAGESCARGFVCTNAACVPLVDIGDPCNEADAICFGVCRNGTCEPRAALGEPCLEGNDCVSRTCAGGICIDDELCQNRNVQ